MTRLIIFVSALVLNFSASALDRPMPPVLSQTGMYSDIKTKTVAEGVTYFAPQYPLWTDGAEKHRWIFLPPGQQIDTTDMDRWVFPVGTRFWKEFSFRDESGKLHRIETRFMRKESDGAWSFVSYKWNAEESDATLVSENGEQNVFSTSATTKHDIPSLKNCKFCHDRGGDMVEGFDALQLSDDRDPLAPHAHALPAGALTLKSLGEKNLVTSLPQSFVTTPPRIHAKSPEGRAAMGFLHGNCGGCHNSQGRAAFTGQFLRHEVSATAEGEEQAFATTVNVESGFKIPTADESYRILPGAPESSAVHYRMAISGKGQMPPVGRKTVDAEAEALIAKWIRGLSE